MENKTTQTQIQSQEQSAKQEQKLSAKQILCSQLTELSLQELQERIDKELDANPVLERDSQSMDEGIDGMGDNEPGESDNNEVLNDPEDGPDAMPEGGAHITNEALVSTEVTFRDTLMEQMAMMNLSDDEEQLMGYLINSLEDDGLLYRSLSDISDELAFNNDIYVTEQELEAVLSKLQGMEPAGIGGRNLQECLLLQLDHRLRQDGMTRLLRRALTDYWDDISHSRWDNLAEQMQLNDEGRQALQDELQKLNPRPGAGAGESMTKVAGVILPDFIVETDDDGHIRVSMNNAYSSQLCISDDEKEMLKMMQEAKSRREKEARKFLEQNMYKAQTFIEAIKQREHTLLTTMRAIIVRQRPWFKEGDEELIRPMRLEDIADSTGLDVSTVSRACKNKYVQTQWGIYELKWFFGDAGRQVKIAIRQLIEAENPRKPLSDEKLCTMLKDQGFDVARRTVAKYREAMKIPTSKERRR